MVIITITKIIIVVGNGDCIYMRFIIPRLRPKLAHAQCGVVGTVLKIENWSSQVG